MNIKANLVSKFKNFNSGIYKLLFDEEILFFIQINLNF